MEETEIYYKVHKFLREDLHLTDMMERVFSFMFTLWTRGINVRGQTFLAQNCGISKRETKQIIKCLIGIGIVRKLEVHRNGTSVYGPCLSPCETTTEAKLQLVHAVHRCTAFTGEQDAPVRCTRCTFGGAYDAPHNTDINTNKDRNRKNESELKFNGYSGRKLAEEDRAEFNGQDTL